MHGCGVSEPNQGGNVFIQDGALWHVAHTHTRTHTPPERQARVGHQSPKHVRNLSTQEE